MPGIVVGVDGSDHSHRALVWAMRQAVGLSRLTSNASSRLGQGVAPNSTIEQLTVLATVFLPLTFITGFSGQNFGWLVHHIESFPAFVVYGIGGLVVPLILLFSWLRFRMPKAKARAKAGAAAG